MRKGPLVLLSSILVLACSNVCVQSPEELGRVLVDSAQQQQSKRLCTQQNDAPLRLECEHQAKQEFEKYKIEQQKVSNDQ